MEGDKVHMKVLVVGANGQIGKKVVDLLQESQEHAVRALVRKQEQADNFSAKGIETYLGDLEGSVDSLAAAMEGIDVVVFSAGSGGATGYDKTILIDLDGAVKTMEAAEQAGVSRFVMVSSILSNTREKWTEGMKPYYAAKRYADQILKQMDLTYTIIRPGALKNEAGTGKVNLAEHVTPGSIPREDVAKVVVASLDNKKAENQEFDLVSGETPIEEAFTQL